MLPIEKAERAVVESIADCLKSDETGICKGIDLAVCTLDKYKDRWDMRRAEEEKQLSAFYFSGAALLVILLI